MFLLLPEFLLLALCFHLLTCCCFFGCLTFLPNLLPALTFGVLRIGSFLVIVTCRLNGFLQNGSPVLGGGGGGQTGVGDVLRHDFDNLMTGLKAYCLFGPHSLLPVLPVSATGGLAFDHLCHGLPILPVLWHWYFWHSGI
ncbi:hypothetical protein EDC04DRAFT_2603371 [Pisolithus marmoratus]|nr:hypothetical protein EDC04DRAFT_2603371 [Pisolithus marmoratus]